MTRKLESLTYREILSLGIPLKKYLPGIWLVKNGDKRFPFEPEYEYKFSRPTNLNKYPKLRFTGTFQILPEKIDEEEFPEFKVIDYVSYVLADHSVIVCNGRKDQPKFVLIPEEELK